MCIDRDAIRFQGLDAILAWLADRDINSIWPGLLEAWLALTSVKYHGNLLVLIPLSNG